MKKTASTSFSYKTSSIMKDVYFYMTASLTNPAPSYITLHLILVVLLINQSLFINFQGYGRQECCTLLYFVCSVCIVCILVDPTGQQPSIHINILLIQNFLFETNLMGYIQLFICFYFCCCCCLDHCNHCLHVLLFPGGIL